MDGFLYGRNGFTVVDHFVGMKVKSLLKWVERLDVETDYTWPNENDVIYSCVRSFKENVEPFYRKGLFIVFEVVGPTEYSEYSMMPPRPESGYKYDLAYYNLDFFKTTPA